MRYLVNFHVMQNGKKITAIKDVRDATGMGLAQAKQFVEALIDGYLDSFGGDLICNAEQVARLLILDMNSRGIGIFGPDSQPSYSLQNIRKLDENNAIDISGIHL